MDYFRDRFRNVEFSVFSDDLGAAKLYFPLMRDVVFAENRTDTAWGDLSEMARFDHNIIANSTYSWWAAWLNSNPNKIVIAPKYWFSRAYCAKVDCTGIAAPQWIKLDSDYPNSTTK